MASDRDPSKTAAAILSLGGPDMAPEGGEEPSGEVPIDSGDTALGMAAADLMQAVQSGNIEGVKTALNDAISARLSALGLMEG